MPLFGSKLTASSNLNRFWAKTFTAFTVNGSVYQGCGCLMMLLQSCSGPRMLKMILFVSRLKTWRTTDIPPHLKTGPTIYDRFSVPSYSNVFVFCCLWGLQNTLRNWWNPKALRLVSECACEALEMRPRVDAMVTFVFWKFDPNPVVFFWTHISSPFVQPSAQDYFVHGDDPCVVDGRDVQRSCNPPWLSRLSLENGVIVRTTEADLAVTWAFCRTPYVHVNLESSVGLLSATLIPWQLQGMKQPEKQADSAQFQEQTLGWKLTIELEGTTPSFYTYSSLKVKMSECQAPSAHMDCQLFLTLFRDMVFGSEDLISFQVEHMVGKEARRLFVLRKGSPPRTLLGACCYSHRWGRPIPRVYPQVEIGWYDHNLWSVGPWISIISHK